MGKRSKLTDKQIHLAANLICDDKRTIDSIASEFGVLPIDICHGLNKRYKGTNGEINHAIRLVVDRRKNDRPIQLQRSRRKWNLPAYDRTWIAEHLIQNHPRVTVGMIARRFDIPDQDVVDILKRYLHNRI